MFQMLIGTQNCYFAFLDGCEMKKYGLSDKKKSIQCGKSVEIIYNADGT